MEQTTGHGAGKAMTKIEVLFFVSHACAAVSGLCAALGTAALLLEQGTIATSRVTVPTAGADASQQPSKSIAKQYFDTI
jgi:hypothetical protein